LLECRKDLVSEAAELVRRAIESYFASKCRRMLSMVGITGQREVAVEFYGFYRSYAPSENFPRFTHAYSYLEECAPSTLEELLNGGRVEGAGEERRLVISVRALESICRELEEG